MPDISLFHSFFVFAVNKEKLTIYFFSASSEIFDVISDELFGKWNFHLVTLAPGTIEINLEEIPDLIILDTLSLQLELLEHIKRHPRLGSSPVLVVDDYQEQVLIDKIVEKGASEYLHIDDFIDRLSQTVEKIIHSSMFRSIIL
ncbi:hypothetical protein FNH22_22145 [Fulvivirga sp. M361]|uniref:hypothetical protein n=1 Tax=Fulvivirga sp. M361 TaxID=2594266 RepID=UPI00117BB141|nr:hypothetical protein [Fulvivirga sp. M361]TRX52413.1 hypothetical protein FNH22_22145 [Fulvivirga sp. M361]